MKLERATVRKALRDARGCVADAAKALGCTRQAVYDAVERYRIRKPRQRDISEKRRQAAYARWNKRTEGEAA